MDSVPKVFLGGTINESTWRQRLIAQLKVPYFDPVVPEWNYAAQVNEDRQKAICRYHLYVVTPLMMGVYSIAELTNDAIKYPVRTYVCFLKSDDGQTFDDAQWKSLLQVAKLVQLSGAKFFTSLESVAVNLNATLSIKNSIK